MKKILIYILLIGILIVIFPETILGISMILSLVWWWVSEFWIVIFLPIVIILFGSLLKNLKFPDFIYNMGCLGIIIGLLGIFGVLMYMLFF